MTDQYQTMSNACFVVGLYWECGIGVTSPSTEEAASWYRKAAEQGHDAATERLKQLGLSDQRQQQSLTT